VVDVDELLRTTLKRVAEPGDPTGVADAIRSRVAAGDTGAPAPQPSGGGWWLPWAGAGLVVAVAAGAVGASGFFGGPAPVVAETMITVSASAPGLDCPGGSPVTSFSANDRVLATARSDDGAFLAVRDGYDYSSIVWLPTRLVALDSEGIAELPVDGCLEPQVSHEPDPEPEPSPPPAPHPEPQPQPAPVPVPAPTPDTTAPTPLQWWADPTTIYCPSNAGPNFPGTTTIHLMASDSVAVTGATVSWSGAASGSGAMTASGGEWRFSYTAPAAASGGITFSVTARDAAGNVSAARSMPVTVTCLF
jgi:hypothetical protein